jgi:hypothetical protein
MNRQGRLDGPEEQLPREDQAADHCGGPWPLMFVSTLLRTKALPGPLVHRLPRLIKGEGLLAPAGSNPIDALSRVEPQPQAQLPGVVLNVTDVVDMELGA